MYNDFREYFEDWYYPPIKTPKQTSSNSRHGKNITIYEPTNFNKTISSNSCQEEEIYEPPNNHLKLSKSFELGIIPYNPLKNLCLKKNIWEQ